MRKRQVGGSHKLVDRVGRRLHGHNHQRLVHISFGMSEWTRRDREPAAQYENQRRKPANESEQQGYASAALCGRLQDRRLLSRAAHELGHRCKHGQLRRGHHAASHRRPEQ